MKLSGNLLSPLKFSSLKNDMTWFDCFQKFIVSCCPVSAPMSSYKPIRTVPWYLIFRMALEKQHVHDGKLVDVSVLLELLAQPRADDRHR